MVMDTSCGITRESSGACWTPHLPKESKRQIPTTLSNSRTHRSEATTDHGHCDFKKLRVRRSAGLEPRRYATAMVPAQSRHRVYTSAMRRLEKWNTLICTVSRCNLPNACTHTRAPQSHLVECTASIPDNVARSCLVSVPSTSDGHPNLA